MALTVRRVEALLRAGKPAKVTDSEVKGLMLVTDGKGNGYWQLRYQIDGKVRYMGRGSASEVTLAEARERGRDARKLIRDGIDPLEQKRVLRAAKAAAAQRRLTFKEAASRLHMAKGAEWSSRHSFEFLSSLERYAFKHIGNMDVADVDRDAVLRVLEQPLKGGGTFWTARAITADRVRNRIERVLDWGEARGYRVSGTANPARWAGFLDHLLPKPHKLAPVQHLRALPYDQVPPLMMRLAAEDSVAAQAVRFIVSTIVRMKEGLNATWDEIDQQKAEWVIPAARMKARRPHTVPLSPQVLALLAQLPREADNPYLFISSTIAGKPIGEMSVTRALRVAGCNATMHGFRSSFSTWANERTSFPGIVIEMSLAHAVGTAVEKAYRRTDLFDKRRKLMEQWSRFCCMPPVAEKGGVVPLRRQPA